MKLYFLLFSPSVTVSYIIEVMIPKLQGLWVRDTRGDLSILGYVGLL